jgi:hypothetical protein
MGWWGAKASSILNSLSSSEPACRLAWRLALARQRGQCMAESHSRIWLGEVEKQTDSASQYWIPDWKACTDMLRECARTPV